MANMFKRKKFSECSLEDPFFETLKNDYLEFPKWFKRKSLENEEAFVFEDKQGISAFVYLKKENEEIKLVNKVLPAKKRLKIGTLKLDNRKKEKDWAKELSVFLCGPGRKLYLKKFI